MIPKKLYVRELDIDIFNEEAEATRSWVANRPNTGRREYTDLSQVWHEAKEEPKKGECILGEYQGGIYQTYLCGYVDCEWSSYAKVFSLIRWAYANDLLPKGGEQ